MNRKILSFLGFAAIALVAGLNVNQSKSEVALSNMALANVEALADDESSNCHNTNGYKSWSTSSWFGSSQQFYDCCTVLREGYSPSGNCQ